MKYLPLRAFPIHLLLCFDYRTLETTGAVEHDNAHQAEDYSP